MDRCPPERRVEWAGNMLLVASVLIVSLSRKRERDKPVARVPRLTPIGRVKTRPAGRAIDDHHQFLQAGIAGA
jgi:hypothetical protein